MLVDICQFRFTPELAARVMGEVEGVAGKLGVGFKVSTDKR